MAGSLISSSKYHKTKNKRVFSLVEGFFLFVHYSIYMATRIQLRHDTASNWQSHNPILLSGEIGIETDSNYFKIGNGISNWNSLSYFSTPQQPVEGLFSKKQVQVNQDFQIDSNWYNVNNLSFEVEANKNYRIQSFIKMSYNYYSGFSSFLTIGFNTPEASSGIIYSTVISESFIRGSYFVSSNTGNALSISSYTQNEYLYLYVDGIIWAVNDGIAEMKFNQSRIFPSDLMSTIIQGSYLLYKEE